MIGKLTKDMGIVFVGNAVAMVAGMAFTIILSRHLGPADFGVLSTAMAVMAVAAGLSTMGLRTAMVRFVASLRDEHEDAARFIQRFTLLIVLGLASLTVIVGLLLAGPLADVIFGDRSLAWVIRLSFVGAFGVALTVYVSATLQAYQAFVKLSAFTVALGASRIVVVLMLLSMGALTLKSGILAMSLVPVVVVVAGMLFVPTMMFSSSQTTEQRKHASQYLNFSKWIAVSFLSTTALAQVDVIMVAHFRDAEEVGIYAAAVRLAMVMQLFIASLVTALLPEVSRMKNREQFIDFIRNFSIIAVPGTVVLLAITFVLIGPVTTFLYGAAYVGSGSLVQIFAVGLAISFIANPISLVLYALDRPGLFTGIHVSQLALALAGYWFIIPVFGITGAATVKMGISIFAAVVALYFVARLIQQMPSRSYTRPVATRAVQVS
jgi:O-antigen/teichoic acid export membrane protein